MSFKHLKPLLRPPGNGVFTVHTASDIIENVQQRLYGKSDQQEIKQAWEKSLDSDERKPLLLGVCSDCGGGIHRGANWGPLFVRQYLLDLSQNRPFLDLGDLPVIPHLLHDKYLNEETISECREALYGDSKSALPVSPLSIAEHICDEINKEENPLPVFSIGGDHSVSYPLVKSWIRSRRKAGKKVAIIHFDAHTDLLDKRQGIDLCFATWAYHIINDLDSPSDLIQLGIRSSGKDKNYWEKNIGIKQYWASELLDRNPSEISADILKQLRAKNVDEVYVSFDIDAIDETYASATGTPEKDGLGPELPPMILTPILKEFKLTGADLVEVAPWIHRATENPVASGATETLLTAASLSNFLIEYLDQGLQV